jgi:transcription termination factor Rho
MYVMVCAQKAKKKKERKKEKDHDVIILANSTIKLTNEAKKNKTKPARLTTGGICIT